MTAYPAVVLLQQAMGGYLLLRAFDGPARLLLVVPVFRLMFAVPAS